jgi:hypothetical protein
MTSAVDVKDPLATDFPSSEVRSYAGSKVPATRLNSATPNCRNSGVARSRTKVKDRCAGSGSRPVPNGIAGQLTNTPPDPGDLWLAVGHKKAPSYSVFQASWVRLVSARISENRPHVE